MWGGQHSPHTAMQQQAQWAAQFGLTPLQARQLLMHQAHAHALQQAHMKPAAAQGSGSAPGGLYLAAHCFLMPAVNPLCK